MKVAEHMQKHHAAREVFLTQMVDNNDVESLWRHAQVCLPDAFETAVGDDVFICEYEYDTVWQVGPGPAQLPCHTFSHQYVMRILLSCSVAALLML